MAACVHEIALGNTDMCWGDTWPTAERQRLGAFSGPLWQDHFFVLTFREPSPSVIDGMFTLPHLTLPRVILRS